MRINVGKGWQWKAFSAELRPNPGTLNLCVNSDLASATEFPGLQNAFCPGSTVCRDLFPSGAGAVPIRTGLKLPRAKSDVFQAAQVLRFLLQRSGAFCQAGRQEPTFSQESASNLVSDRLIHHTPETFHKPGVPNLLVEGPRAYLQFAVFLQDAT